MPFTVSHVAAILPLTGPRTRRIFVPCALVIGAMVPDVALFAPALSYGWSHAPIGLVTLDLGLGLVLFLLWELGLRRPLVDLAPIGIRDRVPSAAPLTPTLLLRAALSVVAGATTHIVWDAFTHVGRWGTQLVPVLAEPALGGLPGYKVLQFGSGAGGALILLVWLMLWWRRTPPRSRTPKVTTSVRVGAWALAAAAAIVFGARAGTLALTAGRGVESIAFTVVTRSVAAGSVAVVAVCLAWWAALVVRRERLSGD